MRWDVWPKGTLIIAAEGKVANDGPMRGLWHLLVTVGYREHFVAAAPVAGVSALVAQDGERLRNGCPRRFPWLCK